MVKGYKFIPPTHKELLIRCTLGDLKNRFEASPTVSGYIYIYIYIYQVALRAISATVPRWSDSAIKSRALEDPCQDEDSSTEEAAGEKKHRQID